LSKNNNKRLKEKQNRVSCIFKRW